MPEFSNMNVDQKVASAVVLAIEARQLAKRVADATGELTILDGIDFTVPRSLLSVLPAPASRHCSA
jgi:hypothetical protein